MGWVYNLQTPDPDNHIPRVIAICMTCSSVALIAVALRFYIRIWVKKDLWVDDYAALTSAVFGMGYSGLAVAQTRLGLGLHEEHFPEENTIPFSKMQYAGGPIYALALLGFKISLLASYLRLGGFVHLYRMVILGAIIACACNQVAFALVHAFGCNPVAKQWDTSLPGHCINTMASYYSLAGTSLGFDVIIIALPMPILAKLQLKLKQKILLVCLFSLGFFVTIIQIIRILTIKNLKTYTDSEPIITWSVVEISLGVIISCVPTYGPYFRAMALNISTYKHRPTHPSQSKSYHLSTRNTKTVSRVYDNSVPTTVGINSRSRNGNGHYDSQESILQDTVLDRESGEEQMQTGGDGKGMGIRIATEVRVETRPRKPDGRL